MKTRAFPILFALLTVIVAFLFFTHRSASANFSQSLPTKQLAGPPADILSGIMRLPDPADAGIRSHAAMLPIYLTPAGSGGWAWQSELPVDSAGNLSLVLFTPEGAAWDISVQPPGGTQQPLANLAGGGQPTSFGINAWQYPGVFYMLPNAPAGIYQLQITTSASPRQSDNLPHGYIAVTGDSPYRLYTHLSSYNLLTGQQVGLVSYIYRDNGQKDQPASVGGVIRDAGITLYLPDGSVQHIPMLDDGQHADGAANDGVFGGVFTATQTGDYTAQVLVRGETPAGRAFMRSSAHTFPIITPSLALNDAVAQAQVTTDNNRWQINLSATPLGPLNRVNLFAEVWGSQPDGQMAPIAWIGGIVQPTPMATGVQLSLSLDGRWLARAQAAAPFELRQVRVQDVNTHIPLAVVDAMPLLAERLPATARQPARAITGEMLTGPRPAADVNTPEAGSVLMLIHGYCSNSVWPTANFTNYTLFEDYNQNRSHDEFAQLIGSYGAQFDSFGAVAHSQGGAASLHLYTYYWSGLNYATGPRLIQSVGTPYQGTALAGNLALLGQIFGVGCGTNWDLTYDGSALWLAGIPTWARDNVYYYTTSDKDVWWRWDFCNPVTTMFLDDPDDGVVEQWSGQLSGGNNMGHKQGWCHIDSWVMRDPGQTTDASRNSVMNANAAR